MSFEKLELDKYIYIYIYIHSNFWIALIFLQYFCIFKHAKNDTFFFIDTKKTGHSKNGPTKFFVGFEDFFLKKSGHLRSLNYGYFLGVNLVYLLH